MGLGKITQKVRKTSLKLTTAVGQKKTAYVDYSIEKLEKTTSQRVLTCHARQHIRHLGSGRAQLPVPALTQLDQLVRFALDIHAEGGPGVLQQESLVSRGELSSVRGQPHDPLPAG